MIPQGVAFIVLIAGLSLGDDRAEPQPPPHLRKAWDILNQGRVAEGCKPFKWHDGLHKSAQELADWGWETYMAGKTDVMDHAHHDLFGRLDRAGWVYQGANGRLLPGPPPGRFGGFNASESGSGGSSSALGEDGRTYPREKSGWCHPFRTPETHARETVWAYTKGITNPKEGHRWDFHAGYTHAAIGYRMGMFVIDYGYLPETER
jgi:hypothetical protein